LGPIPGPTLARVLAARPAGRLLALVLLMPFAGLVQAADVQLPGLSVTVGGAGDREQVATALRVLLALTVLSLAPSMLIALTAFTRIVIVLSMLRHALGMQETPPNTVIVSLALFLTLFTMLPVIDKINTQALQPLTANKIAFDEAAKRGVEPLREFMLKQTRESDMALMVELSREAPPKTVEDVKLVHLIPAFMLNELRTAFQIGFVVFLPFLLIDLIVSSVLMSLGMMMVPPVMISLPLKVLMFVLIDGWALIVRSLVGSFH
jgi:flagellar biosynthetic protein FliP